MKLEADQIAALKVGSKIYPLVDADHHFEVTHIQDKGDRAITLRDSRTGEEKKGLRMKMGKWEDNDLVLAGKEVSEIHAIIDWGEINPNTKEKAFRYRHIGLHPAAVEMGVLMTEVVENEIVPDLAEDEVNTQVFVLEQGSRIHFRYDIPEYIAHIFPDSIKLVRQGRNDRYPAEISAGRSKPSVITPTILGDKNKAMIEWDKDNQYFTLTNEGDVSITCSPGDGFIREQLEINKNLELPFDIAKAQLLTAKALSIQLHQNMEEVLGLMQGVQDLELATMATSLSQIGNRAKTEDSQRGYELWLRVYQILYADRLDGEEKMKLDKMIQVVHELGEDRSEIRRIEKFYKKLNQEIPEYRTGNTASYMHAPKMEAFAERKLQALKQWGEVYLPTGFRKHHIVSRIWVNKDGDYNLTTCNASIVESKPAPVHEDPSGELIMVSYDQRIKNPQAELKELIRLLIEKKLRKPARSGDPKGYAVLCADIESKLDSVGAHRNGKPQGKENCTTRSTREALHDALGEKLFVSLFSHVSEPNNTNAKQILEALDIRIQALERIISKGAPMASAGYTGSLEKIRSPKNGPVL